MNTTVRVAIVNPTKKLPAFKAITDYADQLKKMSQQKKNNGTVTDKDFSGFYRKVSRDIFLGSKKNCLDTIFLQYEIP